MPCTTILVGKKASYDGSTIIARNEDYSYRCKKAVIVNPKDQPRKYKSSISHLEIELPENPMRYSACPNVKLDEGIWAGSGFNEANVGMTATETITSNPRVLGADPLVVYKKAEKRGQKDTPGGIGEEDMNILVLPYVKTAREGVLRLGKLLETYGTYEMNGIAFNDKNEAWWLETIGGHHWMARRVQDDEVVIMPNQLGIDYFDFKDAYGKQKDYLCSDDLQEFVEKNHLDVCQDGYFNPRDVFGSRSDSDHVYNTPRGWYMARYFLPNSFCWDGEDADFTPESDNIPWNFIPEKKVTIEDIQYVLSSHYQGTPYDSYCKASNPKQGLYRPISVSTCAHTAIMQIRGYLPKAIQAVEWVSFGSTMHNAMIPFYANVDKLPDYLSKVTEDPSTENFFWASRMLAALADPHYRSCIRDLEAYQNDMQNKAQEILHSYDEKMVKNKEYSLCAEANQKICAEGKKKTFEALDKILLTASKEMKNTYIR